MCTIAITSFSHVAASNTTTDVIVNGTATNTGGSGCSVVDVTVTCGTNTVTGSSTVVGGLWSITLNTSCICDDVITITATCTTGGSCSDTLTAPITCSCCPSIGVKQTILPCTTAGLRPIQFDVTIDIPFQCYPVSLQLDFGDTTFGLVHTYTTSGTFTFTEIHNYNPSGFPYTGSINVLTPSGCPPTTFIVNAPPCPSACCPLITAMNYNVGNCDSNGDRPVTLMATVAPNPTTGCSPIVQVYWDYGDSTSGPIHTITSSTTISDTHTYDPSGSPYTATLVIVNPTGCTSPTMTVSVPSCPACQTWWGALLCAIARGAFVFFGVLALTFITVGLGLAAMSFPPIAAGPVLLLGLGFFLLWLLVAVFINNFCVPCNPCAWYLHAYGQILFICFFTVGLFWAPITALITVSVIYGFLGLAMILGYASVCNLSNCALLLELFSDSLLAIVFTLLIYFTLIALFPPLVGVIFLAPPLAFAIVLTVIFAIAWLVNNC